MKKTGYTTGVFDLFHVGHLNMLKNAKSLCDKLIVGVSTDELVSYKNKKSVIPFKERAEIVASIKYVDVVVSQENMDKLTQWKKLKFDILFVGDDWFKTEKWEKFDSKIFPTAPARDLVIHPREHDLVIGTFGRAAWVLDDIRPLREVSNDPNITSKEIHLFGPPEAYMAAYQQPTGSRFGADAIYNGENRKRGAMITYFFNPKKKNSEEAKKNDSNKNKKNDNIKKKLIDSIKLKIYDGERLIRTIKKKAPDKKGFYRIYWQMDEKGVERPSRRIRNIKSEPSGVTVKPGIYSLNLTYRNSISESEIKVSTDPRLNYEKEKIDQVYNNSKILESYLMTTTKAVKQLVESKETIKTISNHLKKYNEKKYDSIIKSSNKISKRIDELLSLYIGKEDKRQGITRNPETTVMRRLSTASTYVLSRKTGISKTEITLMKHLKEELDDALVKTNSFFESEWIEFKSNVEKQTMPIFKEVENIKLEY